MIGSERHVFSELPQKANLQTATMLNQQIWRKRDKLLSASVPIEVSERFTKSVFDRVSDKLGKYINSDNLTKRPLVGYSIMPEISLGWNYGYYYPDLGKVRPTLFEEFSVDWLTCVTYDKDPLKQNVYLNRVYSLNRNKVKEGSREDLLVQIVINSTKGKISQEKLTKTFANFLLKNDMTELDNLAKKITDGKIENYASCLATEKSKARIGFSNFNFKSRLDMTLLKPVAFTVASILQFSRMLMGHCGTVNFPGIINLSGIVNEETLAHEYIHILSFHENRCNGIPIKSYILGRGITNSNKNG